MAAAAPPCVPFEEIEAAVAAAAAAAVDLCGGAAARVTYAPGASTRFTTEGWVPVKPQFVLTNSAQEARETGRLMRSAKLPAVVPTAAAASADATSAAATAGADATAAAEGGDSAAAAAPVAGDDAAAGAASAAATPDADAAPATAGAGAPPAVAGLKRKRERGQHHGRSAAERGMGRGDASEGAPKRQMCRVVLRGQTCRFGNRCRDAHDVGAFLATKEADIGPTCPVWVARGGTCPAGVSCRFAACHTDMATGAQLPAPAASASSAGAVPYRTSCNLLPYDALLDLRRRRYTFIAAPINGQPTAAGAAKRVGPATAAPAATAAAAAVVDAAPAAAAISEAVSEAAAAVMDDAVDAGAAAAVAGSGAAATSSSDAAAAQADAATFDRWRGFVLRDARLRREEKRRIDFAGKVYVAPLTTCGNLPFRRVMKGQGADITCGEMALATELVAGSASEWALVRRHPSEDVFGVQITGHSSVVMAQAAELLERHVHVDFVDINAGCPIDLVCDRGMGACLMTRTAKLRDILIACDRTLSVPVTLKMRTGYDAAVASRFAHRLLQRVRVWSLQESLARAGIDVRRDTFDGDADAAITPLVAAITVHGRTRQQRYSKYADWEYIATCAAAARAPSVTVPVTALTTDGWSTAALGRWGTITTQAYGGNPAEEVWVAREGVVPRIPLIGNGDVLSWEGFEASIAAGGGVDTALLARGCLIKPWLPREIKGRCTLDVRSGERLQILRDFVAFGLDHWGSDATGVAHTRRYLLEWLSFLHRYVPAGMMERLPLRMGDRPPAFVGRDDLETLMASSDVADWVRITELVLGPTPAGFVFVPKHKSNSYVVVDTIAAAVAAGAGAGAGASGSGSAGASGSGAGEPVAKRARMDGEGDGEGEGGDDEAEG